MVKLWHGHVVRILVYELKLKSHTKILKFNHFRGHKLSHFVCVSEYGHTVFGS